MMKMDLFDKNTHVAFSDFVDLACEDLGGKTLYANDDFFAPKENLLKSSKPIFIHDQYTENGKWMDGWESRRKRNVVANSNDFCILQLARPGIIHGVNVDTSFFVGNFPEYCSIQALNAKGVVEVDKLIEENSWKEILPKMRLQGGSNNLFPIENRERWTHLKLSIFPDGGVARLRVHGKVVPERGTMKKVNGLLDLIALENGGTVVACSDMFFGNKDNLIFPGRAKTMGEGWETRRRRGPGFDWIVIKTGISGKIKKIEVDTNHFKGNFPESCSIEGIVSKEELLACDFRDRSDLNWTEILPRTTLQAHYQHLYEKEIISNDSRYDYIRLNIFPDGGISRLRVFGEDDASF